MYPLCLGGNVFGWSADREQSFAVLDAYAAAGGNFIDTADAYSFFHPGNVGGESETIIGDWMASRGNRDAMVIATKVGHLPELKGLSEATIRTGIEGSLRRLQTDHVDLYYPHYDDPDTPLEETLGTFDALVREGKVRHIAASNFTAERLSASLEVSARDGLVAYVALQTQYNLVHRQDYEGGLRDTVAAHGLVMIPYYSLARGFLSGKYRDGAVDSVRARGASAYLTEQGLAVLAAMDVVAASHGVSLTAVALAWLAAQPTVATPLASARILEQLPDLLQLADLELTPEEIAELTRVSAA